MAEVHRYVGYDVHANTPAVRYMLHNNPRFHSLLRHRVLTPAQSAQFNEAWALCHSMMHRIAVTHPPSEVAQAGEALGALNKIAHRQRTMPNGYYDDDTDVNVALLFTYVVEKFHRMSQPPNLLPNADPSDLWVMLRETLAEIGQHCVAGDSHRLLVLLYAVASCATETAQRRPRDVA